MAKRLKCYEVRSRMGSVTRRAYGLESARETARKLSLTDYHSNVAIYVYDDIHAIIGYTNGAVSSIDDNAVGILASAEA